MSGETASVLLSTMGRDSARSIASFDQLDRPHWLQGQLLGTFTLHSVRDGSCNVKSLHGDPVAAIFCRRQLAVVDDIVRNDILLYFTTLCCDYIVSALARCNENQTAVCVALDTVIDINHAPVGHHHWHLDLLEQAASAFDIWELYEADFVIYFRELNWQGISERLVLCVSQAGH